MMRLYKTRMVLLLCLSFALSAAGAEEKKEEPKLKCPVDNPLQTGKKREATPREAGREAADWWKTVTKQSNNQNLKFTWITKFANCLEASNLSMDEIVTSRSQFRHLVLRTYQNGMESLRKNAETIDLTEKVKDFREQTALLKKIAPELAPDLDTFVLNKEEIDDLMGRKASALAEAQKKCGNKDLSSRLGMVRNQTDIGWCYAFAASDLVTFRLGASTAHFDRRVSAADLAFLYNREFKRDEAASDGLNTGDQDGGWMADALKAAIKHGGYCREKDSPSEDFAFGSLKDTIEQIEKFRLQAVTQDFSDERLCFAYKRVKELFPNVLLRDFAQILKVAGDRNLEYFEKLNDRNCRAVRKTYGITEANVKDLNSKNSDDEGYLRAIDEQLDKNNIAAIGFSFGMISDEDSGAHAVTVVGRKFDDKSKTCKYLLRNSWGPGCSESLKKGLCAEDHTGHLWVDRDEMKKYLTRVTYIE